MSEGYRVVNWTPFKRRFDAWMLGGVLLYIAVFWLVSEWVPAAGESFTPVQILIRATGTLAFALLSFVLCLGPLARLSPRFKPFVYNRRHLGVTTFLIALAHAVLVLVWYHGFGDVNAFVSLLVSNPRYDSLSGFPFESLGLVALLILAVMAATSHDFWNAQLGPRLWKAIHLSVAIAFGLVLAHVVLGALQTEAQPSSIALLALGTVTVVGLQLGTAWFASGRTLPAERLEGWLKAGAVPDIPEDRAKVIEGDGGQRIAVFRYGGKVAAVSNVCRHQGGPLGEGRIVDGCITCPWHGYQYRPEDGCSPPPFTEKIATYRTRIRAGIVYVHPAALPPGTPVAPSLIGPPAERA